MITSLAWIPCGVTPKVLEHAQNDESELNIYLELIGGEKKSEPEPAHPISEEDAAIIAKYDLDNYDNEGVVDEPNPEIVENDEYLTNQPQPEEDEDDTIKNSDYLLIVGKSVDPDASLEVHVFDYLEKSFYPHHEIMLPSFPLSICWIDGEPQTGNPGSYAAVSSMQNHIEIWNLNVLESIIPSAWLIHHTDSIPALSWNPLQRFALLSASIDGTAAIWNLKTLKTAAVFNIGNPRGPGEKYAQAKTAEWNPKEKSIFAVGSDEGLYCYDARAGMVWSTDVGQPMDTFAWLNDGVHFLTSLETGEVLYYDSRNTSERLFSFQAHSEHVTGIAACKVQSPQIIATIGEDEYCRIWSLESGVPEKLLEDNMGMGPLFTCQFCPDRPMLLAVGGNTAETRIWDIELDLNENKE